MAPEVAQSDIDRKFREGLLRFTVDGFGAFLQLLHKGDWDHAELVHDFMLSESDIEDARHPRRRRT